MYKSGVTVKAAKQCYKNSYKRNPEGTLPSEWKCPFYHPNYCTKLGHAGYTSQDFEMKGMAKGERDAIIKIIEEEAIALQVYQNASKGKQRSKWIILFFYF